MTTASYRAVLLLCVAAVLSIVPLFVSNWSLSIKKHAWFFCMIRLSLWFGGAETWKLTVGINLQLKPVIICIISQITEQIKTLYPFSGIRHSVRYRSAVDDVCGTHPGVGEFVPDRHLISFSGADAARAFVSAAKRRFNVMDSHQERDLLLVVN